jgi:hypothetical protein
MKRFLILVCCACAIGAAVSSCGGADDASAGADKLTIVGAGS